MNVFRASVRPIRPVIARVPCRAPAATRIPRFAHRGFATDPSESDAGKLNKPKASTPLRRAASASLPIRSNPTPTRSSIQSIFTITTANRYALGRLPAYLPQNSKALHDAFWVPSYKANDKEGEVFVFGNGSIVCWGLGEEEAERFAQDIIRRSRAEIGPLREVETEDLEFVTDPSERVLLLGNVVLQLLTSF